VRVWKHSWLLWSLVEIFKIRMGNPLKEVELGGPKDPGAKPPSNAAESAEVPLLSESSQNDALDDTSDANGVEKKSETPASNIESKSLSDDLKQSEEKLDPNSDSLARNVDGGDDQAPLLSQQFRSDEARGTPPPLNGTAATESVHYPPELLKEMEVKYAAYVRHDVYGNWGMRKISLLEKLQLVVALVTLCPLRIFVLFGMLVLFYVICKVCTLRVAASSSDEGQESFAHMTGVRRTIIVRSGRFLARAMLFTFGFYYIPVTYRTSAEAQRLHLGPGDSKDSKVSTWSQQ
jgi:hypothetical protein